MKTAIALGTFDGVHIGHRAVIKAASENENALVLAFSVPPKSFFVGEGIVLTDIQRKTELIKGLGIKKTKFLDFKEVKDISAQSFFESIVEKYDPKSIFCGENYTFGKDANGNVELLGILCKEKNIKLNVCPVIKYDGQAVSSSFIRELLKNGEIKRANELLSSEFSFCGEVIHGDKRGRTIGFPTINQEYPLSAAVLKRGVYRTCVLIDGKTYDSISNVGIRPTYATNTILCETFIKGFSADLYGKNIRVLFKDFIREEKKFSGLDELKEAIKEDCSVL